MKDQNIFIKRFGFVGVHVILTRGKAGGLSSYKETLENYGYLFKSGKEYHLTEKGQVMFNKLENALLEVTEPKAKTVTIWE